MLDSTLWVDRDAREVFITALLMALPCEIEQDTPQLEVRTLERTGWCVPPGWYGLVSAAGVGIIRRAGLEQDRGLDALERLGSPEPDSRSHEYDGRRLVRVDGGYIALNYDKYRRKDHTAAARSKRYRDKHASRVTDASSPVTGRSVTQAEAEAYQSKNQPPPPDQNLDTLTAGIPPDYRDALAGVLRAAQAPIAAAASIRALGPGGIHERYAWEQIGRALFEMAAAGGTFGARRLEAFCRKVAEPLLAPEVPSASRGRRYPTADEADAAAGIGPLSRGSIPASTEPRNARGSAGS